MRDELQEQAANYDKDKPTCPGCCAFFFHWKYDDKMKSRENPSTKFLPSLYFTTPLFCSLMSSHKRIFITQGLLKFLSLVLSFSGPLLLGQMVSLIEKESDHKNVLEGILLTAILGFSFIVTSIVNVQYSIRGDILRIKIKNSLSLSIFSRAIDLPLHAMYARDVTEAEASNMLQVLILRTYLVCISKIANFIVLCFI